MERAENVAIVGVGLIGGSIGLALRACGASRRVVGVGRDAGRLDEARRLGAIDAASTSLADGVAGADVVVVCTPVSRIAADVRQAAAAAPAGALVTDAGSTKRGIVAAVEADDRARRAFVGAHPIAGSERRGAAYGRADLFEGRACVLTPTDQTPDDRLEHARDFWEGIGCRVTTMSPSAHDDALALTSHLPHAVAAALAATVPADRLPLAAGAYRDGTRVAGADPGLWAAILAANRGPLLEALAQLDRQLAALRAALEDGDEPWLRDWWAAARSRRRLYDGLEALDDAD